MKTHSTTSSATVKRRRRGLALIEVLLCSTIAAMMLTATAVAFKASVGVYRDNTDRNILLSHGRTAMRQIINEMRQADVHGPINDANTPNAVTLFAAGQVVEVSGIQLLKKQPDQDDPGIVNGNSNTYVLLVWQYNSAAKTITRTRSVGAGAATTATIAKYVQDFKVRMEPARSAANIAAGNTSYDLMLRGVVSILMQNQDSSGKMIFAQGNGTATERIIDAAVPRRNFSGL
jgi:Tfp pilus assembly protein PilW